MAIERQARIISFVAGKQHAVETITDLSTKQMEDTYRVKRVCALLAMQGCFAINAEGSDDYYDCLHPGYASKP